MEQGGPGRLARDPGPARRAASPARSPRPAQVINIPDAYADTALQPQLRRRHRLPHPHHPLRADARRPRRGHRRPPGAQQATHGAFTDEDEELLLALGGQAAGAIENALLHEEINRLFEGFVSASVVAIESRDPTTAGHSGRVASLTVGLAEALEHAVHRAATPASASAAEDMQEMRYASLLHDFGKVGVREHVLVKAEKLYPQELDVLRARFALARKDRQLQSCERRLDGAPRDGKAARRARAGRDRAARGRAARAGRDPGVHPRLQPPHRARPGRLRAARRAGAAARSGTTSRPSRPLLLPREVERLSHPPRLALGRGATWRSRATSATPSASSSQIPWTRGARAGAGDRLRPPREAERQRATRGASRPRPSRCSRR